MLLDDFLTEFFENITDAEGINNIKEAIKKSVAEFINYDAAKVETQVLTDDHNLPGNLCINSEAYPDGEIIFLNFNLDGICKKCEEHPCLQPWRFKARD